VNHNVHIDINPKVVVELGLFNRPAHTLVVLIEIADALDVVLTRNTHAMLELVRSRKINELFSFHVFSGHHIPDLRVFDFNTLYLDITICYSSFDVAFVMLFVALINAVLFL